VRFEEIRKYIDDFIASKLVSFYRQGIRKQSERWQRSLMQTGNISLINIFCLFFDKDLILQKKLNTFLYAYYNINVWNNYS